MNSTSQLSYSHLCTDTPAPEAPSSAHLHALCEDWALWFHTRKHWGGPTPPHMNSIARWAAPMRAKAHEGRDAPCSADMQLFHRAVQAQPMSKARRAFEMYYLGRVRPVKSIAGALGVSRQQVHNMVNRVAQDAYFSRVGLEAEEVA